MTRSQAEKVYDDAVDAAIFDEAIKQGLKALGIGDDIERDMAARAVAFVRHDREGAVSALMGLGFRY